MFKSFAVLSLLTSAALAQSSSSSAAAAASTDSAIPSDISDSCSKFLSDLNADATFAQCLGPLASATNTYLPNGGSTNPTAASMTAALDNLCSSDTAAQSCSDAVIRGYLANFQLACDTDLTNANQGVQLIYDTLYILLPLKTAVCSKGEDGNYCVTEPPSTSTSGSRRRDTSTTSYTPDSNKWTANNIAFLLLNANLPSSALCTTCTRNILGGYIAFESDMQYAPGLSNSLLFSGQSAIYDAVQSVCGKDFLSGAVQNAGGLSGGLLSTSGARSLSREFTGSLALIMSLAGLGAML